MGPIGIGGIMIGTSIATVMTIATVATGGAEANAQHR
jgi:hypothetical protein